MAQRWYLVHAQTGRETVAEINLVRQGYQVFLPISYRTVRHARKVKTIRAAFFPSYLFVAIDLDQQAWRPINGTYGVVRLVASNDRPLPAPDGLVESLQALCSPDGALALRASLNPGDVVKLVDGPFTGLFGQVEALSGPDRVRVLLDVMNRKVSIELPQGVCLVA